MKSSAIAPSSMASSSRWVPAGSPVCRGGRCVWQASPRIAWRSRASCHAAMASARDGLRVACGIRGALDQAHAACAGRSAAYASRLAPRRSRSRVLQGLQSDGHCRCAERRTEPLVAPHGRAGTLRAPARRTDDAAARHRDRRAVRQARNGTRSVSNSRCEPRCRDQVEQRAADDRIGGPVIARPPSSCRSKATSMAGQAAMTTVAQCPASLHPPQPVRRGHEQRIILCCGGESLAAAPMRRCGRMPHRAMRHRASIRIQSCPRPMIGARKRNRLPVPAPRSSRRGRAGSRSARRRASATLRAA